MIVSLCRGTTRSPGSRGPQVRPIQSFSNGILAEVIRRQPASRAKTTFAWQLAVGPALARVTTVELEDGRLLVRSTDPRWAEEIRRAREVVLARLQHLLGPGQVERLVIEKS